MIDLLTDRVLVFENGHLASYTGAIAVIPGLDSSASGKMLVINAKNQEAVSTSSCTASSEEMQRILSKLQREKEQAEANLAALEKRISEVERDLADPNFYADPAAAAPWERNMRN